MIWNLIEFVNALAEMGIICVYFNKLMKSRHIGFGQKITGYLTAAVIMAWCSITLGNPIILLSVTFVLLLTLAVIFYDEKLIYKIFYSFIYIVIILITDPILVSVSYVSETFTYENLFQNGIGRMVGMIISKIMYFWMAIALSRILTKKVKELPLKYWISIILIPIISIIVLYGMTIPILEYEHSNIIIIYIIAMLGIIYINIAMFNFFDSYSKQLKLSFMETVAEREAENYKALKMSYQEMKKLKHDFKNELDILNNLIADRKYEIAEAHIAEISDFINKSAAVCYTGNEAVDSLINIKIHTAKLYDIKVITKMKISTSLNANSMELCRIFGNALDNAIEACCKLENAEKFICISIKEIKENVLIEILNSANEVDTTAFVSTKSEKGLHGYGIQSIRSSAERIEGALHFKYDNGVFIMKLLIKNEIT
ncbi:MAG: GHKL domain-containing protein [Ruminococcus sp.]|nr:GHKL domain-containing protein [Ruminococcus sp.]